MKPRNTVHRASLSTRVLQGAAIAVAVGALRLVSTFGSHLAAADIVVGLSALTIGGGLGGGVYYATDPLRSRGNLGRTAANVISLLVYCFVTVACLILFLGTD